jgi:hypothetical protein
MKCQHIGCTCEDTPVEKNGRQYCSDHCADADSGGHHAPGCGCRHTGCKQLAAK